LDDPEEINRLNLLGRKCQRGLYEALGRHSRKNYVHAPALSGFAIMAACAAGELLAAHLVGSELPPYAPAFTLERYKDPEYQKLLENWGESGQL